MMQILKEESIQITLLIPGFLIMKEKKPRERVKHTMKLQNSAEHPQTFLEIFRNSQLIFGDLTLHRKKVLGL